MQVFSLLFTTQNYGFFYNSRVHEAAWDMSFCVHNHMHTYCLHSMLVSRHPVANAPEEDCYISWWDACKMKEFQKFKNLFCNNDIPPFLKNEKVRCFSFLWKKNSTCHRVVQPLLYFNKLLSFRFSFPNRRFKLIEKVFYICLLFSNFYLSNF